MTKVILEQVGDGVGFAFPSDIQRELRVEAGQEFVLVKIEGGFQLVRHEPELEVQLRIARRVLTEQAGVLKALADFDRA